MEEKKMTEYDMYMFAWSVLHDELAIGRDHFGENDEKANEDTMTYLARRYMERSMSALRCGRKKGDVVVELTNDVLRQRIMAFNEYLKREKE